MKISREKGERTRLDESQSDPQPKQLKHNRAGKARKTVQSQETLNAVSLHACVPT